MDTLINKVDKTRENIQKLLDELGSGLSIKSGDIVIRDITGITAVSPATLGPVRVPGPVRVRAAVPAALPPRRCGALRNQRPPRGSAGTHSGKYRSRK